MSYDGSWTPPADDPPDRPPPNGPPRERSPFDRPAFTQPPFVQLPPATPEAGPYGEAWPTRRDESQGPYGQRDRGWEDGGPGAGGVGARQPGGYGTGDGSGYGAGSSGGPRQLGPGGWGDMGADPLQPGRSVVQARRAPLDDEQPGPRHGGTPRRGRVRLAVAGLVVVGAAAAVAMRQSGGGGAEPGAGGGRWQAERFGNSQMLVSDDEQVCSVTSDSLVYCLDPATGDEVFSRQLYLSVVTSPTLADGGVLIGGSSSGSAGTVFAYTADGEDLWEAPVDITSDRPLLVVGGVVVLVSGDGPDAALVGLDLATGVERWRVYGSAGGTAQLVSPRVFTDGSRLYVALAEEVGEGSLGTGFIVAVDPASGQEIWRSATMAGIGISRSIGSAAPFADGSAAAFALEASPYAGEEGGRVVVLDSATGAVRWEVPTATSAGVAHVDGLIVSLDGSDLRAYDSAGVEAWTAAVPVSEDAPAEPAVTSLVLDGDRLFGIGRGVYAVDPATGETEIVVDSGTTSDVAVAGDSLVVASVFAVSAVPLADLPFGEQQVTVVTG